jgi:ATP-dependent protease Clp ATPase subunit
VTVPPVVAVGRLNIEAWVNSLQQKKIVEILVETRGR